MRINSIGGIYINRAEKLFQEIKKRSQYANRQKDKGIINDSNNSINFIDEDGNVKLAASKYSQYKLLNDGTSEEITFQKNIVTNRCNIQSDEILINKHKVNPMLYSLSDMRNVFGSNTKAIGNINLCGSVLVKAYDLSLKKEVLIRRPIHFQPFSPTINLVDAPQEYNINTSITDELNTIKEKGVFNYD